MQAKILINGKHQQVSFYGFYKRVVFKDDVWGTDIVALIARLGEGYVETVRPEEVLFDYRDSDRLEGYLM
jgi:hypothetical protein